MSAVGLQIVAAMDSEESTIGKWVVGASKYAALCAGAVPYAHNISTDLVEERFGIFFLEPLPPPAKPPVLKLHRCMVCRKRLAKQHVFMSRGIAFCSPECRSSGATGRAKVEPISSRNETRKTRQKAAVPQMAPPFQLRGLGALLTTKRLA